MLPCCFLIVIESVAAIIVNGGSFARYADLDIHKEVTKNAADKGYTVLKASHNKYIVNHLLPSPLQNNDYSK